MLWTNRCYKSPERSVQRTQEAPWLKFQSVVVPDGMIVEMFGPVEGRRHDVTVLKASKLEQKLVHLPGNAYTYRSSVPSKAMAVVTLQRAKQTSAYAGLEQKNENSAHICRTWV